ncbi:hypothetical protein ACFSCZ_00740 [Siminovitchia sediminis]|uniref:Uncharacterized protein n=1 Tax=Siminovitchia sediminis TaxID=1274353 RepID=A0ABW4KBW7_9BACI
MILFIKKHSFLAIFFIVTWIMGILFIFHLTEETPSTDKLMGSGEPFVDQQKSSQGIILNHQEVIE